ncbi:MAG: helicase HerA-like domain-containing protein [Streptosporangiaceae bacterium]
MTSPWRELCGLDAYRINEIPRRPDSAAAGGPRMERDPGRAQRIAALVAAYHAGGTVAFGWIRLQAGGPVRLLAAGASLAGSSGAGEVTLALPGGARGQALGRGALASAMSRLACWRAIGGISDGLLLNPDAPADREQAAPSLEECLLPAWAGPFGWLVVAKPVPAPDLEWLAEEAARHERLAIGLAERFPERDVAARRLRHRHTELRLGRSSGMWHIHLLAGGADPAAADRVAALVCASADLSRLPYALAPAQAGLGALRDLLGSPARRTATAATGQDGPGRDGAPAGQPDPGPAGEAAATDAPSGPRAPFYASTALLAALARSPEAEIPGVRLALRPDFDVTPETAFAGPQSASGADAAETPAGGFGPPSGSAVVSLGQVLDRQRMPAGPLQVPVQSLNRHVFVCGATGGGKSQTVRALLEGASRAGVPWLVVEPAKAEYRLMAARLTGSGAQVVRIRPGEADAVAAGLNPLEPAVDDTGHRFPLQTHADLVRALFLAAFQSAEPFPQVLSAALTRMYEDSGWDLALGEPLTAGLTPGYPGLGDLQRTAEQVVGEIGYSEEVKADVLGFIRVRLSSLRLGTTGRFLEGGHPVDVSRLLRRNTVLEIEDVGDDRDKAFLMGTVLLRLAEHLRLARRESPGGPGLRHLTVVEEAHRLLRRPDREGGPAAHAVELFAGLLAEVRAYGEGIVIAEQIPAKLIPDVIKNTAVKIVHRLPAADDREAVGATMNLSPAQSQYLVTLAPGEAAASVDGTDHPLLVMMPDGTARESAADPASTAAGLAGPACVVASRSGTCGADCIARPCTLRDMRAAQRVLERYPGIALWAELAVLSHLTGWPMPIPQPPLLGTLRALPMRLRDCALSHGVDAAVASRAPLICARVSPPALASHVVTALRARVSRGMWMCLPEEPRWLAPAYQWALLLDALTIGDPAPAGAGPDSRTGEWESVYGRPIAGPTRAAQAATVQRWHDGGLRDDTRLRGLAFGLTAPSALERAVGAGAGDEDFGPRLADHLEEFEDCYWPHLYLKRAGTEPAAP